MSAPTLPSEGSDASGNVSRNPEYEPSRHFRYVPRLSGTAREEALADPGPTWHEWFYYSFLKVWIITGFFVVDAWVLVAGIYGIFSGYLVLFPLVSLVYLEFLAYQFLWRRPSIVGTAQRRWEPSRKFHRSAFALVEFGRWTPEGEAVRAGRSPSAPAHGPDPREFL